MLMTLYCVASEKNRLKKNLEEWRRAMQDRGLKINRKNCIPEAEFQYGNLDGNAVNEDLDADMTYRIQSGWNNWNRVSWVLCDRRKRKRFNGKVYKTVVRPAMVYGVETQAVKKAQAKKLDAAEMRMLRWMSGVTKLDRIANERIRGTTKVGEISKKVQESRLKWYHHHQWSCTP